MTSTYLPNFIHKKINALLELHIIQIKEYSETTKELLDKYFVQICAGRTRSTPETVKRSIHNYLLGKNSPKKQEQDKPLLYGAIAEFFIHLHLNTLGYKQECLFKNLEENSIKKGFDGLYSQAEDYWVMESKSGFITTVNIKHCSKVKEAYKDLGDKISGKAENVSGVPNNPWANAYNHASLRDVGSSDNLLDTLHKLQDEFTNDVFHRVEDYNVMPCSTIFLLNNTNDTLIEDLESRIVQWHQDNNLKNIRVICINFDAIQFFLDYINPENAESIC